MAAEKVEQGMKEEFLKRTCVFCGEDSPVTRTEAVFAWCAEHIKTCKDHPLRQRELEVDLLMRACAAVSLAYKSAGHSFSTEGEIMAFLQMQEAVSFAAERKQR